MILGKVPVTSNVAGVVIPITVTPGTTVTLNVTTGGNFATWTTTTNQTLAITGTQFPGQTLTLIILNDGTLTRTTTFGTGFRAGAVITGIINKASVLSFVSNGTIFFEVSRSTGL